MSKSKVLGAYAVNALDENLRYLSSSGGVFSLIANYMISIGGVVYGVVMADDCKSAAFSRASTITELKKMRGSKYLPAFVGDTFRQVKRDLDMKIPVLFTGTGCQVNGLKAFLGKEYENFYCVDVLCHGIPSAKIWNMYLDDIENEYSGSLIHVDFRSKRIHWKDFELLKEKNKITIFKSLSQDPYMQMFLKNYSLRPSCYTCQAKEVKKSDLTIADFWGIEHCVPELYDRKGSSLVLIRTKNGDTLYKNIEQLARCKEVNYEDAIKGNPVEYQSVSCPDNRNQFFADSEILSFKDLSAKYVPKKRITIKDRLKKMVKKMMCVNNEYGILFEVKINDNK